ncbi:methyltransferase [Spiroplasma sabaudiense Ar-1343]|uniref:Methyltransferase n=1 Tax=Spiroplasma sabaudiense Ar-1343 TaxID=1276257 RepID=W6AAV2_9MOLU|nr:class I SAM-dependent methyltransferase [Spiroplasma sabaudiense]AHI54177.1 methyltransferase [Spiroplasma sabaudiense Ar-1343]
MKNYYGKLSSIIYNLTKPVGYSIDGDLEFYFEKIKTAKGIILEAGVGTGRMLIPFLRKGLQIEGIDSSSEMLQECQANVLRYNQETELIHGQIENFNFTKKYSAIIMPTGSICLIQDRTSVKNILEKYFDILEDDGQIIIDLIYPNYFKPNSEHEFDYKIDKNSFIKLKNISKEIDWINQKTSSHLIYEKYIDNELKETEVQNFDLNWYGMEEFKDMLLSAGFRNIEFIKNYGINRVLNLKTLTAIAKK